MEATMKFLDAAYINSENNVYKARPYQWRIPILHASRKQNNCADSVLHVVEYKSIQRHYLTVSDRQKNTKIAMRGIQVEKRNSIKNWITTL